MLDKLLLNNQLISNKSKVQQAKVNLINKLVSKIRKLKNLHEKSPDNNKISKKLTKSTNILSSIKKTKHIGILKRALLNVKDPTTIITNDKSTPEEISDAMFFSNNIIIEIVTRLKLILNLDDANNPGWREEFQELSKKQKKSLRTEAKQKKRQERKARNALDSKRNKWLEENVPISVKVEIDEENGNQNISERRILKESDDTDNSDWKVERLEQIETKKSVANKLGRKFAKIENEEHSKEESIKSVDPFFVTQNGENYISSVPLVVDQNNSNGDNREETSHNKKRYFENKKSTFLNRKNVSIQKRDTSHREILSWKTKQDNQGIKKFKGKKILFDDMSSNLSNNFNTNNMKKTLNSSSNNTSDLHPSWAAKQKMKPSIKEFQGKKVVFDNSE